METEGKEILTEREKKLTDQVNLLSNKLIDANSKMQNEIDKSLKVKEDEYNSQKANIEMELQKSNIDRDNALSAQKNAERLLKKIKDTAKLELQKSIAKEIAKFDFAPQILELCDKIDSSTSADMLKLNSICITSNANMDYVSQQRVYATILNIKVLVDSIITNCNISNLFSDNFDEEKAIHGDAETVTEESTPFSIEGLNDDKEITLGFTE